MPQTNWVKISTFLASAGDPPDNYIPIPVLPIDDGDAPAGFTESARQYASVAAMEDDGFLATDQVVLAATEVFGQGQFGATPPTRLVVAKRAIPVAQVEEFEVLNATDGDWKLFISVIGASAVEAATFAASGDTITVIKDGLISAFNLGPFAPSQTAATVDTETGSITADVAGVPFILTATGPNGAVDVDVTNATPNSGIFEDLDAAFKLHTFWAVIPDGAETEGTMIEAGRWAEASKVEGSPRRNVVLPPTADADIQTATEPNFASLNVLLARTRTFPLYHQNTTDKVAPAWFGNYGGQAPGSRAWHLAPQGGTTLTTTINYSEAEGEIFKAARVSWIERDGPAATAPVRASWGQGSGGLFVVQKQAEDFLWLRMGQGVAALLHSRSGVQLSEIGIPALTDAVWQVLNILGTATPPVIDLDQTTVVAVPIADVPPSAIQIGEYVPPDGGVAVNTVLIAHGRTLGVSTTLALA